MSSQLIKIAILSCAISFSAYAIEEEDNTRINTSGFLAAGISHGLSNIDKDKNEYEPLYEGGLRSSLFLPNNFLINGQVLYSDMFVDDIYEDNVRLDYLTLDWISQGIWQSEQTVSIGRFKNAWGIYGNTRDIPFTRPSVALAQSVYSEYFRSIISNTDGIRMTSNFLVGNSDITAEIGYGNHTENEQLDIVANNSALLGVDVDMKSTWYFDLKYRYANWLCSFTYRNFISNFDVDDNALLGSISGETEFNTYVLGIQYQMKALELTVEGISIKNKYSKSNTILDGSESRMDGIYAQARYLVLSDLALMLRYDTIRTVADTPEGFSIEWAEKYYTWSTGITWNFASDWQFSLEVHERQQGSKNKTTTIGQLVWSF